MVELVMETQISVAWFDLAQPKVPQCEYIFRFQSDYALRILQAGGRCIGHSRNKYFWVAFAEALVK